jgi:chromosome segregation ATPase
LGHPDVRLQHGGGGSAACQLLLLLLRARTASNNAARTRNAPAAMIFADALPATLTLPRVRCVCVCVCASLACSTMIDKLKSDNEQLKDELQLEKRHAKVYDSVSAQAQIAKLQDTGDMYTRKIELEKRRIEELDKQMEIMHKKIWEQRQKMGGVNASRETNQAIAKQIQILENRLDKALKRYNEALANNKRLRENIDNLRRERLVFDQIYRKLEKELAEKKKEMARIIEISNKAYEARDAAQGEMAALKSQADKEQDDFEREWKELGKMIEQDRKMKDFMKKEREKLSQQEHRGDMTVEQEQSLKKKVLRGNWGIAKDKASIHASMEKVQSYEEAFAKIQAATGISDIDELVTTFINAEDQNFALFNYVNELNGECEKLEEQISEIRSEIEKYKGQGLNTDNQRKKILKDLEERLARTEAKAEQYEKKYEAAMKTVNALKVGIASIFKKIGCDTPANLEMLGNEGVTEGNMMQYLGIIEQRTNEILQLYAATQAREGVTDASGNPVPAVSSILGQGPQVPAGRNNIQIQPPSATDEAYDSEEDSDDEDEDRPFSRDELKAKTMRGLHKRENKEKKKESRSRGGGPGPAKGKK